jgi:hypothetical protein
LYTAAFQRTLSEHLSQDIHPLCPRHQEEFERLKRAYALSGPTGRRR